MKKGVLKSLAKFTGKHLCQSLFFNKKGILEQVFSCEFLQIFSPFSPFHLWTTASVRKLGKIRWYVIDLKFIPELSKITVFDEIKYCSKYSSKNTLIVYCF